MKSYAFNYSPQNQTFGQQFLYDGVHDFEYWKSQNPKANYNDYWHGIRDAFVERNFNVIESLTNDLSKAPIKDIANMTAGMSDTMRVAQTISSKQAWEAVSNITNNTGTIMSIDLETIGDITTKHQGADGINILKGYTGVTEVGFHYRNYLDGIMQPNADTFTFAIGLDSKRTEAVGKVVAAYDLNGYKSLTATEQRLIDTLSTYGHNEEIRKVFTTKTIDGLDYTILTDATEKAIPDPLNKRAVHIGFQHLRDMWGNDDKVYARKLQQVQDITLKLINESISDSNTAIISANSAFEATVLSDWGVDAKSFMDNSADLVYANTTIAKSKGISVYSMQKNASLSNGVTGDKPASVQNSAYAAGLDNTEYHHGGSDAKMQVDIAVNKFFIDDKSYSESVLNAIDNSSMPTVDYEGSYFYLRNGNLDKNKLDHAVVDGKPTQTYSIRGQYYKVDEAHSDYVLFTPQGGEEETVYALSMVDDNGNRFTKQFQTRQEANTWLENNASIMSTKWSENRKELRAEQRQLTEADWGRRMYDSLFNPSDVRMSDGYEELNGFEGLTKYLDLMKKIEDPDNIPDELFKEYDIRSDYQKRAFRKTYDKIQSEKSVLEDIVSYIDTHMKGANNLQKTIALRDIRNKYIEQVKILGYEEFVSSEPNYRLISDALGIDIQIDNEYKRVNGDSIGSIRYDLNRIFKDAKQEDIVKSIKELGERQVLSESVVDSLITQIESNTAQRSTYYSTVFDDIAIQLSKVTEPIANYESPITFMNTLAERNLTEAQRIAIENKLQGPRLYDAIRMASETRFKKGNEKSITLSGLKSKISMPIEEVENIIKNAQSVVFDSKDNSIFDVTIKEIGAELGYTENQTKLLNQMFTATKTKNGVTSYAKYAINGRDELQSFIIAPSEHNTSAFILVTNQKHSSKVGEKLLSSDIEQYMKDNEIDFLSRSDIADIFDGEASVIELKKINRTEVVDLSKIFGKEAAEDIGVILGGDTVEMTTINQGNNLEKFVVPTINVYESNGKVQGYITESGEDFITTFRKTGERFLESVEEGDFSKANMFIAHNQNDVMRKLSSPSSYRGYNGKRLPNYNGNDISHGFYFDGEGLFDAVKLQTLKAVDSGNNANPLYQLTQIIGIATGDLKEESLGEALNVSKAESIINSSSFNEFFAKNILTGNVAEDQTFKEVTDRIKRFSNIKKEAFNKNILGMMIDEANSNPLYSEEFTNMLKSIQKASPYMTQILSETNVHKYMFSFLKPGDYVDLGLMNSTMRPTYVQMLNAIRFDPEQVDVSGLADVKVGPISRTYVEQSILDKLGKSLISPSGKPYDKEERIIMSPVKQMNDMELQIRYRELDKTLGQSSDTVERYAYNLFKEEYLSLHEGKFFGAPTLLNQEPFKSSDIKKVKIEALRNITETERDKIIEQWVGKNKKITEGNILTTINGTDIYWEGPSTYLTRQNIIDFTKEGESIIEPSNRMVADTKFMLQQEKGTVHTILIDDEFMKRHGHMFSDEKQALQYMQNIFDKISGYDASVGYQPMFIANLSSYKHGTAIAPDSMFRIIAHEYEKAGQLREFKGMLNQMDYFKDWKFSTRNYDSILVSQQLGQKGAEEAIHELYDNIMKNDTPINLRIREVVNSLTKNNISYLEAQRMLVNEIMGSKVMMDERMTQSIRLRELEREFQPGRSFENQYIDQLKANARNGYYENGSMVSSYKGSEFHAIHKLMDDIAKDRPNNRHMRQYRHGIKQQEKTLLGINESLKYYVGGFDVDAHNVITVNINDVLKNLPDKNITHKEIQDLIFNIDGKPSNFLREIANNSGSNVRDINASSIFLDFGTSIKNTDVKNPKKSFSGVLVPIFDVHLTENNDIFFTNSQNSLVRFLNVYKENIGNTNNNTAIMNAIESLYASFAKEMQPFNKDSLLYKTAGKILLPNSAQSLAQDEVAPIVDAMMSDEIIKTVNDEWAIRNAVALGDFSRVDELDNVLSTRKAALSKIKDDIIAYTDETRDFTTKELDSLFNLTGLSAIGKQNRGYEIVNGKRYFANTFEMNLDNFKRHGIDTGVIGYQIFEDALESGSGKLTKFESNEAFETFLKNSNAKKRIIENLQKEGITFDEGKSLLKQINNAITEDTPKSYMQKIYDSMSFLGEKYLQDVGIVSREVWRPPVFGGQTPGRIFLNDTIGNNQLRALTGGTTSIINHVDFDGDMYMLSLSLNGNGGLRTLIKDNALRQSYLESLKSNNRIIANLIESGDAFKKDSVNDIAYYRLQQIKRFDEVEYVNGLTEWTKANKIYKPIDDLTESELLKAAHSKELRNAYARFSDKGSMLTDEKIIMASIAARVRKDNIGSISTPNYKFRDTLETLINSVTKDGLLTTAERKEAFEILQDLTSLSADKLLNITEQTGIDTKHVFDGITLAETPKWARGMSMLFSKNKDEGLRLMMTAVNNSTFAFKDEKEFEAMFNKIINTSRDDLRKGLNGLKEGSSEYAKQNFALQFRAMYDAPELKNAKEIHKYILRNKNAATRLVAEELVNIDKLEKALQHGSVMDDMLDIILKAGTDLRFQGNKNHIYFDAGSVGVGRDKHSRAYMINNITKSNVYLEEVTFDENNLLKKTGNIIALSDRDTDYKTLNKLLNSRYSVHVNVYDYINGLSTEGVNLKVDKQKIFNTLNDIIEDKKNLAFDNFFAMGNTAIQDGYGLNQHAFVSSIITRDSISQARELFEDYKYYAASNKDATGVDALIRGLNKSIAEKYNPESNTLAFGKSQYHDIARNYILNKTNLSQIELDYIHKKRTVLGSFDIEKYNNQKNFLNENLYDIISSEKTLNESFDELSRINEQALKNNLDVSPEMQEALANRNKTISETLANINAYNDTTIKQVQDNIYKLFKDTQQMDTLFEWSSASTESVVGFGKYLGTKFSDLSINDAEAILNMRISNNASALEQHAFETTQNLLRQYKDKIPDTRPSALAAKKIHDSVTLITEQNSQFAHSFDTDFIRKTMNDAATASSGMKRKTISGGIIDSLKNIDMKSKLPAVGMVVGSLAALGIANNLLHNDKHKSPVSPEFSNDHNDPGFKNNSVTSPQVAPPSKGRTIYVDKPSGLQFKVSAKTNNYISDVNNAKLIGLANGGHANVYSQQDTSGVTDNWLANKFAELT